MWLFLAVCVARLHFTRKGESNWSTVVVVLISPPFLLLHRLFFQNVENAKHEMAVDLLKTAVGKISLVVRYSPSVLEEMEKRFERTKSFHASRSRSSRQH